MSLYISRQSHGGWSSTDVGSAAKVDERPLVHTRPPQHVGGLEVAVHGARGMHGGKQLHEIAEHLPDGDERRPHMCRPRIQRLPLLHSPQMLFS